MNQEKTGKFIAAKRKERGLTQEQLAERLGITKNAVSKWKRGLSLMDMALLKPLSAVLEVEVVDILSGETVDKKNQSEQYEKIIAELFHSASLNKKTIKKQYCLFEIMILTLTIAIATLAHSEIVTLLAIVLMVVANTFNLAFYVLSKNVVILPGKVRKES